MLAFGFVASVGNWAVGPEDKETEQIETSWLEASSCFVDLSRMPGKNGSFARSRVGNGVDMFRGRCSQRFSRMTWGFSLVFAVSLDAHSLWQFIGSPCRTDSAPPFHPFFRNCEG